MPLSLHVLLHCVFPSEFQAIACCNLETVNVIGYVVDYSKIEILQNLRGIAKPVIGR